MQEAAKEDNFVEDVHFEWVDFKAERILFSRVGHSPVIGLRGDTASDLRAQEIYLLEQDEAAECDVVSVQETGSISTPSTPPTP